MIDYRQDDAILHCGGNAPLFRTWFYNPCLGKISHLFPPILSIFNPSGIFIRFFQRKCYPPNSWTEKCTSMLYINLMCVFKTMKKRGIPSLSRHLMYAEKILFPGAGSQGKFSSVSVPLAEIQVNGHDLWSLVMQFQLTAIPFVTPSNLLTSVTVAEG